MIHLLKVSNFFSIGDEITLDFDAKSGGITSPELYLNAPLDSKTTKIAFLGGPNASGKTNILKAIAFLKEKITTQIPAGEQGILNFVKFLGEGPSDKSAIETTFSMNDSCNYIYKIVFSYSRIHDEELLITKKRKQRSSTTEIFSRHWDGAKYNVKVSNKYAPNIHKIINLAELLDAGNNCLNSLIAITSNMDAPGGFLRRISNFWNNLVANVTFSTPNESITLNANKILEKYAANPALREKAEEILRQMDIGYQSIFELRPSENDAYAAFGIRHAYPNATPFDVLIMLESTGTRRLIDIVDCIVSALSVEYGGVAVLDDMDAFIHPDLYEKLIDYFMSPSLNKNGTQLILCSHNYATLNYLDKQQIFLVERNDSGMTKTWRLDEVEGVQARENFYARYLSGAYGAVPRSDR